MIKYLEDSYLKEYKTQVLSSAIDENNKPYYIFLDTIFYPQGGGQPSDIGFVVIDNKEIQIVSVRKVNNEIRHYSNQYTDINEIENKKVLMKIDWDLRYLHMRLHTVGQLLHNVIESNYSLKTIKAHHFPNQCSLEFNTAIENMQDDIEKIEQLVNKEIEKEFMVKTMILTRNEFLKKFSDKLLKTEDDTIRLVTIDTHESVPCCGTHLKNIKEVGKIIIKKISNKKGILKISYDVINIED